MADFLPLTILANVFSDRELLVNSCWLGFGKEFLKTWIVADRIPDRVDLQARKRNELSGRDYKQLAKYFHCFLGVSSARFDFG